MRHALATMLAATLLLSQPLAAQPDREAEIAELRAQLEALTARLEALEATERDGVDARDAGRGPESGPQQVAVAADGREAADAIRLSGDLRYRHETINDDGSPDRHRHRIRARFGVAADVTEDVMLGLTLATGEDNPISANQSLDGGFSRKSIGVDRAFFDWSIGDQLVLRGGKMRNPMFRPGGHPLIFDGDLNPEGLALMYDGAAFFANLAGMFVEERGSDDDSLLLAAQGGWQGTLRNGTSLRAGVSYYDYSHARGFVPFFDGTGRGNTLDALGRYLYDYNQVELFAEAGFVLASQPATVFADFVRNTEAGDLDTGYAIGFRWREAEDRGDWDLAWAYQDLEADAVIATFTDSDFAGGGTDGRGHVLEANYVFRDRLSFGLTYFLNERGEAAGNERDYNRLQADVSFRY